jgi:outer membrane immunogenic protein
MKRLLLAAAFALAGACSAHAADLAARTYTKAPAMVDPSYNWSGFYIGANVGGAWQSGDNLTLTQPGGVFDPLALDSSHRSSIIGGIHAGYNWQLPSNVVLGIEGDFSWTKLTGTTPITQLSVGGVPETGSGGLPITAGSDSRLNWLSSIRGRLGYGWNNWLVYGTGGVAWTRESFDFQMHAPPYNSVGGSASRTKTGWVAGAGLEYALTSNWIVRGEYLYYGFNGSSQQTFACPACVPIPSGNPMLARWSDTSVQELRAGLSYKFGGPVVAGY